MPWINLISLLDWHTPNTSAWRLRRTCHPCLCRFWIFGPQAAPWRSNHQLMSQRSCQRPPSDEWDEACPKTRIGNEQLQKPYLVRGSRYPTCFIIVFSLRGGLRDSMEGLWGSWEGLRRSWEGLGLKEAGRASEKLSLRKLHGPQGELD